MDYSTIVIAADFPGRRMKKNGPKCNIKISESETLLQRQIQLFNQVFNNKCNIVVVVGYMKDKVKSSIDCKNVLFVENKNYKSINMASSFFCGGEILRAPNYIFCSGDIVFSKKLVQSIKKLNDSTIITERSNNKNKGVGCVSDENMFVSNMDYRMPYSFSNILILKDSDKINFDHMYKQNLLLFEILNKMINSGSKIKNLVVEESFHKIDVSSDISGAEDFVRMHN